MADSGDENQNLVENKVRPQDDEDDRDDEARALEEKQAREAARKRCYKFSDPPKIYTDVKVSTYVLIYSLNSILIVIFFTTCRAK